jgi:hypothetical protein
MATPSRVISPIQAPRRPVISSGFARYPAAGSSISTALTANGLGPIPAKTTPTAPREALAT